MTLAYRTKAARPTGAPRGRWAMLRLLRRLRVSLAWRLAGDHISESCEKSYQIGYDHGYAEAHVPESAWREEFEGGYKAGHHDGGLECKTRRAVGHPPRINPFRPR